MALRLPEDTIYGRLRTNFTCFKLGCDLGPDCTSGLYTFSEENLRLFFRQNVHMRIVSLSMAIFPSQGPFIKLGNR